MNGNHVSREVEVANPAGLHARPAADFAAMASRFRADIRVRHDGHEADAKSVLLLLTLDVRHGDRIAISAEGPDADAAIEALAGLLTSEVEATAR